MSNPRYPIYIVSKGRWETRLTPKALEKLRVPYRIVVEAQERDAYASVIDPAKILILDPSYQRDYETCDSFGDLKSKGPGPARNFVWDHAVAEGHAWHWVMDDNIARFTRLNRNLKTPVADGSCFRIMEEFCERYENVAMAGPAYASFTPQRHTRVPLVFNTRIYSCNLIRNDTPYRWRGRYNEDTDLSLRMLKDGWCTIEFNAFLQEKIVTQALKGGNTDAFYAREGTMPKSQMLVDLHPDVARLVWKYNRWHHHVDYGPFKGTLLKRKPDVIVPPGKNERGMRLLRRGAPVEYADVRPLRTGKATQLARTRAADEQAQAQAQQAQEQQQP